MQRHGTATAIVLAGLMVTAVSPPAYAQDESYALRVDSVFAQYDNTRSPGCAVGVIRDHDWILKRGYGMANLELGVPITPTSVFRIGSVSKQFTAASIVLLAQQGALSLEDNIRNHLPELREYAAPITVRHMLNHTSGVRDYLTLMSLAGKRDDDFYTDDDVLAMIARQEELNFRPGDEYLYSNSGYFLLAEIVERTSGMTLREFAQRNIFAPLDMGSSHYHNDHREIVPNRASGYAPTPDGGFRISMTTLDMIGDGGVFTTVEDLLQWDRNFYHRSIGRERFNDELLTRGILNSGDTLGYALGLGHRAYRGLPVVSHSGGFVGFRAEMMRFPTQRFTVICLCNVSNARPTTLAYRVADIFLEDVLGEATPSTGAGTPPQQEAGTPRSLTPAEARAYVGEFFSTELDVTYEIKQGAEGLRLTVGTSRDTPLSVSAEDTLRAGSLTLRFTRRDGQVDGFLLDAGRVKRLRFVRRGDRR